VLDTKEGATAFFAALSRLRAVHSECAALVGSQSAGFELLDALSQHLEGAYERLYHWVQSRRVTLASHLLALIVSMQCGYVASAVQYDSRVNTQLQ
jgi:Conserved oligomeric complex COG6